MNNNHNNITDSDIARLLSKEPIHVENESARNVLKNRIVMITGAAGSIGSELCRQVLHYDPKCLIMVDQAESAMYDLQYELQHHTTFGSFVNRMVFVIANVRDAVRMRWIFEQYHPQIVYHAAAYKHVPFMEENPYEAVSVNVMGTRVTADLSVAYGVERFVMISTDKAVNPTNVMGATKRIAEIYTQSRQSKVRFITTRFGNVLSSSGSVVPLFQKQIEHGGPITVTDRHIIRYFMKIHEACNLVLEAGAMGNDDDVFVFEMGKPVNIWDLAEKMRQLYGRPDIEIKEIGLRPGEKLFEEPFNNKESIGATANPKIMRAKVREYEKDFVDKLIENLRHSLTTGDDYKIVACMKTILPEYVSNNSIFEKLDKERRHNDSPSSNS